MEIWSEFKYILEVENAGFSDEYSGDGTLKWENYE